MTTLYELSADYKAAFNELENSGFDQETIDDTLEGLQGAVEEKAKNVAAFLQNIEVDAEAMKKAEARMAARRKSIENTVTRLKDYLRVNMANADIKKIECPEFKISLGKAGDVVEVEDSEKLSKKFIIEKMTKSVDKKGILEALKNGEIVPGAELVKGKARLTIK